MAKGLPGIIITFRSLGNSAIERSQKGTLAMILKDTKATGAHTITGITEIPKELGVANREYIERAFVGYVDVPQKVILYVLTGDETLEDALTYFATQKLDYIVAMPDVEPADVTKISTWVKSERKNDHTVKAVLPNIKADYEAVINFSAEDLQAGDKTFTTEEYCSRMAGMILGTPMKMSCTYAPLPELTDIKRKPKEELDKAIENGELVLFHDGEEVLIGRGVNSLKTINEDKGEPFQKIKILEVIDMVNNDVRNTLRRNYIGKYANSYDNKCVIVVAIKAYLEELERLGILARDTSEVDINLEKQRIYLKGKGVKVDEMSEQEIREANTDTKVFLKASLSILDAIEDIELEIAI